MMEDQILSWIKSQELGKIAMLRYNVAGIERKATSDWDIAVTDLGEAKHSLREGLGSVDICIDRQYVSQNFFGGEQIDLFERFEWNGCSFLTTERFWSHVKVQEDGIPRPAIAHDALIALLVGLLGGGTFSARYFPLIELALEVDGEEFHDSLKWAVGVDAASEILGLLAVRDYDSIPSLCKMMRRSLVRKRLGGGAIRNTMTIASHWFTELRHHLFPPFPWIAFLGPDGAGKSTVIEGLIEEFSRRRLQVHRVHWRPAFCRETGAEVTQVSDPHKVPPRGMIASVLKLGYFWCDWAYSNLLPLRHLRAKNKLVIADRFYLDLIADPRRYRYGAPLWLASLAFRFFPKPDLTIVLTGDPETLYLRKKEVSLEEVVRQVDVYEGMVERTGFNAQLINSTEAVEEVLAKVLDKVMSVLRRR